MYMIELFFTGKNMAYIDPIDVISPKHSWGSNHKILWNGGDGDWSAAEGLWESKPCLALRWNGSAKYEGIGSPQSRGNPTWFIVPRQLESDLRQTIYAIAESKSVVLCEIYQADGYDVGAWRLEAKLNPQFVTKMSGSNLTFKLPELQKRLFISEKEYRTAGSEGLLGMFVNGHWKGDVYTNGIEENKNPTSVDDFRRAFIDSVRNAASETGLISVDGSL